MLKGKIREALRDAKIHRSQPTIVLAKTRFIGEALASWLAAENGILDEAQDSQDNRIRRLKDRGVISLDFSNDLHRLRVLGNRAVHDHEGTLSEAVEALDIAQKLLDACFTSGMDSASKHPARNSLKGFKRPTSVKDRRRKQPLAHSKLASPNRNIDSVRGSDLTKAASLVAGISIVLAFAVIVVYLIVA